MNGSGETASVRIPLSWWRLVGTVLVMVTGVLAAYYTTIYGIRLAMTEKADHVVVDEIDRRLVEIETLLRTDVARRRDLAVLEATLDTRLTRIETLLEERRKAR